MADTEFMFEEPAMEHLRKGINLRMPGFPFLGFAFWFGWNLLAFSGTVWCTEQDNSYLILYFFIAHLIASVCSLLFFGMSNLEDFILSKGYLVLGAFIGSLGSLFMVMVGGGYIDSIPLFIVGAVLAGIGTTFMIVRSATVFGTVSPVKSLPTFCSCALFAIAVYFIVEAYGSGIGTIFFILLPVFSAIPLFMKMYSKEAIGLIYNRTPLPRQFFLFLGAIFVFSLSQAFSNRYFLTVYPASQSIQCMHYVMLLLVGFSLSIIIFKLLKPLDQTVGRIIYPVAICLVIMQIIVVVAGVSSMLSAVIIDFAGYAFDLLVWSVCAYLAYQLRGRCIRLLCFGTAALSLGLSLGSFAALLLLSFNISGMQFLIINLGLAFASIIMTVLIFPEKKLEDMLVPLEENMDEDRESKASKRARYMEACEKLASENGLSAREVEVLKELARGLSAQEIADDFIISVNTVRAHIRKIHTKLEVSSTREIIALVRQNMN